MSHVCFTKKKKKKKKKINSKRLAPNVGFAERIDTSTICVHVSTDVVEVESAWLAQESIWVDRGKTENKQQNKWKTKSDEIWLLLWSII